MPVWPEPFPLPFLTVYETENDHGDTSECCLLSAHQVPEMQGPLQRIWISVYGPCTDTK